MANLAPRSEGFRAETLLNHAPSTGQDGKWSRLPHLVTGEYEVSGKSKGESTAKRTVGGAAIGSIIGAIAGGGKGAAIGAGTGAGVGAGSEIITKGDQVKIPSGSLLRIDRAGD